MYIRPETMLPIAEALASKGMSLGTVVADHWWCWCKYSRSCIIIETIQEKFVVSFVIAILVVAISTGLMVNIVI